MSDAPDSKRSAPSRLRVVWLTLYYLAILIAVIVLHGRGGLETPKFIYQGF
jgi:hypothetical protein